MAKPERRISSETADLLNERERIVASLLEARKHAVEKEIELSEIKQRLLGRDDLGNRLMQDVMRW